MLQTANKKIQQRFSESAKRYDLLTSLHREIADKLFEQVINGPMPSALLDVGCGTGYLTVKLKEHFPNSQMIGLDFSPGMLEVARPKHKGIGWVLADGNKMPFSEGSFETVISNLAYQWAGDLAGVFSEARRVLAPNGILACTLFGFNTCEELFGSLREAGAKTLQFNRLPELSQIRQALIVSGFNDPIIESERVKVEFNSMYELISWLKSIGANNLSRTGYLGPEILSRAAAIYHKKYSYLQGVGATFEVIRVYAKK
jgi:malonyl-CoA O-methyltransferase